MENAIDKLILKRSDTVLVVVDIQERLASAMGLTEPVAANARVLIESVKNAGSAGCSYRAVSKGAWLYGC